MAIVHRSIPLLPWSIVLLSACSDADLRGPGADAGPGEDASLWQPEIAEPEPPAPPELPRMMPCPEGWRERVDPDDAAFVTCDPWPEGGQQDCAEDEAHFPGRPGCERIGPPCPEGDWPAEIPEDARVLYVRAGEPEGGDGTMRRPFGWIADARSRILDVRGYGLRANGNETQVTATDLMIERTAEQACAAGACRNATGGFGLASESGAKVEVRRFRSADNALVGVLVASDSDSDLHEGIVSGNRIGANVQVDDFDLGRLEDDVLYVGNGVNTHRTDFALPDPPSVLGFPGNP